jgi:hypothetical protein
MTKLEGEMAKSERTRRPKPEDARGGQRPGEEPVQVNDAYSGGGPPPEQPTDDKQHPTGG